jgi:hypothetical protein
MSATLPITRVQWVDGVQLGHADLRDAVSHEARLLDLHVCGIHGKRPLGGPYMGSGIVPASSLDWIAAAFGLWAVIDTSAAGFASTPNYVAELVGDVAADADLIGPFLHLFAPQPDRVTVRLFFADRQGRPIRPLLRDVVQRFTTAAIAWIGAESQRGCGAGGA